MSNNYMREIVAYAYARPEESPKVPSLLRSLVGRKMTPRLEKCISNAEACVHDRGKSVFEIVFNNSVEEVCETISPEAYEEQMSLYKNVKTFLQAACDGAESPRKIKDTIKSLVNLLPGCNYKLKDFMKVPRYTYYARLFKLCEDVDTCYKCNLGYEIRCRKDTILGTETCKVLDMDTCSLYKLKQAVKRRALKADTDIFDNWKGFCYWAQSYYAYLVKYAKEYNDDDIQLNVTGYSDLVSNDTVSFVAAKWLPHQRVPAGDGKVDEYVPCSQVLDEITCFIGKVDEDTTEYEIAYYTVRLLGLAAKFTLEDSRNKVLKLLQTTSGWTSSENTAECIKLMLEVMKCYISELHAAGKDAYPYYSIVEEAIHAA